MIEWIIGGGAAVLGVGATMARRLVRRRVLESAAAELALTKSEPGFYQGRLVAVEAGTEFEIRVYPKALEKGSVHPLSETKLGPAPCIWLSHTELPQVSLFSGGTYVMTRRHINVDGGLGDPEFDRSFLVEGDQATLYNVFDPAFRRWCRTALAYDVVIYRGRVMVQRPGGWSHRIDLMKDVDTAVETATKLWERRVLDVDRLTTNLAESEHLRVQLELVELLLELGHRSAAIFQVASRLWQTPNPVHRKIDANLSFRPEAKIQARWARMVRASFQLAHEAADEAGRLELKAEVLAAERHPATALMIRICTADGTTLPLETAVRLDDFDPEGCVALLKHFRKRHREQAQDVYVAMVSHWSNRVVQIALECLLKHGDPAAIPPLRTASALPDVSRERVAAIEDTIKVIQGNISASGGELAIAEHLGEEGGLALTDPVVDEGALTVPREDE